MKDVVLSLPQASANAVDVDFAFFSVFAIAAAIFVILFILLVVFAVRYRRGSLAPRGPLPKLLQREIEIGWTVGTIFLAIFIFWWFVGGYKLPPRGGTDQLELHIVAKQWMWKAEHPDGAREIDALHLPINRPIRLVMTSEDVIHSFYVPAFRLKQDVLPVRATELIFTPTQLGSFHLFCAEFCGTEHSRMTGEIIVMTASDYAGWLRAQPHNDTLADEGRALYAKSGCEGCHMADARLVAPSLGGLFGTSVELANGTHVIANDDYLRRAILHPGSDMVAGYKPTMPNYSTLLSPAEVGALIAYIKVLPDPRGAL